MIKNIYWSPC